MTNELLVLVTAGGRAVEARRRSGAGWSTEPIVSASATRELMRLAQGTDGWVAWIDRAVDSYAGDIAGWPALARHDCELLHAGWLDRPERSAASLGFVDFSSLYFFAPGSAQTATGFVSSVAGIARASVLRSVRVDDVFESFAAALLDFGLRAVRAGVCAYSEPRLLHAVPVAVALELRSRAMPQSQLALLVRRLHGRRWTLFWLAGSLVFSRSLPLLSTLRALWTRPAGGVPIHALDALVPSLPAPTGPPASVHVVVPTLGRPSSLLELLEDLASQTHLPQMVSIVEQRAEGDGTELKEIVSRPWPFGLTHHCVPWVGVCRARNIGIDEADADWLLLLDDDVRLRPGFTAYALRVAATYGASVVTALVTSASGTSSRDSHPTWPHFTSVFPSGASLVAREAARAAGPFDPSLETGYGEDFEYGQRLRLSGAAILRAPDEPILHNHAPSGGFRTPLVRPWDGDAVQPKPSPTIVLSRRGLPSALQQGYRLFYIFKRLSAVPPYLAFTELASILRQWRAAEAWADRLPQH